MYALHPVEAKWIHWPSGMSCGLAGAQLAREIMPSPWLARNLHGSACPHRFSLLYRPCKMILRHGWQGVPMSQPDALPPRRSISTPAWAASGKTADTMPPVEDAHLLSSVGVKLPSILSNFINTFVCRVDRWKLRKVEWRELKSWLSKSKITII